MRHVQRGDSSYDNGYMYSQESDIEMHVSVAPGMAKSYFLFFTFNDATDFRPFFRPRCHIPVIEERNGKMFLSFQARPGLIMDVVRNPMPIGAMPVIPAVPLPVQLQDLPVLTMEPLDINSLPEMERFEVDLTKDAYGLGITIAGYVCEKGK